MHYIRVGFTSQLTLDYVWSAETTRWRFRGPFNQFIHITPTISEFLTELPKVLPYLDRGLCFNMAVNLVANSTEAPSNFANRLLYGSHASRLCWLN